jgi:CBS domain-containing protein
MSGHITTDPDVLRSFTKKLLRDLDALGVLLEQRLIEEDKTRIGAEQELFLADQHLQPYPCNIELLEKINAKRFTTELARFNMEINLDPLVFETNCLSRLHSDLNESLQKAASHAQELECRLILIGCLPTLRKSDLDLRYITPVLRYNVLNEALCNLRSEQHELNIKGTDELHIKHDSVMLEACNASFQVHFQVRQDDFVNLYNIAQLVAGPTLAAAANSPFLFGRRLWHETRIAVFQQSIDIRKPGTYVNHQEPRVGFGTKWIRDSILDIYREDLSRFRVIMGLPDLPDSLDQVRNGEIPILKALQLFNSTVYRWNRPCYGITDNKPHIRIENRVLPAGPTPADETANAAFWFGLINGIAKKYGDITGLIEFDEVRANFVAAARRGLLAQFKWFDGKYLSAQHLILDNLIGLAEQGLLASNLNEADIRTYLGIIETRVRNSQNGALWQLESWNNLSPKYNEFEKSLYMTQAYHENHINDVPVGEWPGIKPHAVKSSKSLAMKIEQIMSRDVFSLHEDDVIDLAANIMEWRKITSIPVINSKGELTGLLTYRYVIELLNKLSRGILSEQELPVKALIKGSVISVEPDTHIKDGLELMIDNDLICLPVVQDHKLVGIVTRSDFLRVLGNLIDS